MHYKQNIRVAVDAIVFGYALNKLHVLLVKQKYGQLKDRWALVGGFVKDDEGLDDAVKRELQEEAGVKVSFLEQLYTFGDDVHRDPRFRVISIAYFALVNSTKLKLTASTDAEEARWFSIDDLPDLAFDHADILKMAHSRLQNKLSYQPVGFDLLPKQFLFSELEVLYCSILGKEIDRRNFRKKILSYGILEETEKFGSSSMGRPAKLYKFNKQKYQALSSKGFSLELDFA
jgi:8-oxo-dGTP diphosphatase